MKKINFASGVLFLLLLNVIKVQSQTTSLGIDRINSIKTSFSTDLTCYRSNLSQISNSELLLQSNGLQCCITQNQFNFISKYSKVTDWFYAQTLDDVSEINKNNRLKIHRRISAIGLATSYVTTVIVDVAAFDDTDREFTLIPVIGPFITFGIIESRDDWGWAPPSAKWLLILSGVSQTAFATYFVISWTKPRQSNETKKLSLTTSLNSVNLKIHF